MTSLEINICQFVDLIELISQLTFLLVCKYVILSHQVGSLKRICTGQKHITHYQYLITYLLSFPLSHSRVLIHLIVSNTYFFSCLLISPHVNSQLLLPLQQQSLPFNFIFSPFPLNLEIYTPQFYYQHFDTSDDVHGYCGVFNLLI